jgi:chaperonin GroEL
VKKYQNGEELRSKISNGVNTLADNVACTFGPRGRNVILHAKGAPPIITKDGVTVAKFVNFEDPFENAVAEIIKQAASETNSNAGDGTTTSTILARAIYNNTQRYLVTGASPVEIKRGIDLAVDKVVSKLESMSLDISSREDIEHVATISSNGDKKIGKLISLAVDKAGKDGAITVEESRSIETTLDIVEGFRFDSGYFAGAFITNLRKAAVEFDSALILVTDHKIDAVQDILPVLELVARESRPLIIVAEEVEGQALAALIMNTTRGTMQIAAVKAPRYGTERRNIMSDLALSTGATFITRESGKRLNDVVLEDLGFCKKIEVLKNLTTIVDGKGDWEKVEERIETLKTEIKQTDDINECERIQERISRLASGVAIIKIGGSTEIEAIERKHRVEDALEAVKSAQEEGIIPGGGVALLRCSDLQDLEVDNEEQKMGVSVIIESLKEPIRQMAINAGLSPDIILDLVSRSDPTQGYNFAKKELTNMLDSGIIDPTKVTRTALQNAASAASTLLTSNYAIIEVD